MAKREVSGLEDHIGYWLRFVSNHVSHAFSEKVEGRGVTVAEWVLLRQLRASGPVAPSRLAAEMGMTRGAVSKLIDRLCEKALVERSAGDVDRRYQSVTLTPQGAELVPALARLADENDAEFFGHLATKDRALLARLLQDVVRRNGWKDLPVQ